jgi:hypothetical protein
MEILKEDAKQKQCDIIKRAAREELERMRSPFWFLDEDGDDSDEVPYLLGPFKNVHYQERKFASSLDDWIAKKRYGNKVNVD